MLYVYFSTVAVLITDEGVTPTVGQSYTLTCSVSGVSESLLDPIITYQWTKNNGSITNIIYAQAIVGTSSSILELPSFSLSDDGQYTCQVTLTSLYTNATGSQNVTLKCELNIHGTYL